MVLKSFLWLVKPTPQRMCIFGIMIVSSECITMVVSDHKYEVGV